MKDYSHRVSVYKYFLRGVHDKEIGEFRDELRQMSRHFGECTTQSKIVPKDIVGQNGRWSVKAKSVTVNHRGPKVIRRNLKIRFGFRHEEDLAYFLLAFANQDE